MTPGTWLPPVHSPIRAAGALRALARPGRSAAEALEQLLAHRFDADEVVLCGSGTQALQLALEFARRETERDGVLLPAFTCYDLVSAAVGAAMRPIFYDLHPDTLLPRADSVERAAAERPAAMVAVHHFGFLTPLDSLKPLASAGGWLIEDAAQAQGGAIGGRRLGSLAPLSVLSFGRGKGWTGGGGGALLLRHQAAGAARDLKAMLAPPRSAATVLGRLGAQWLLARPGLYALPASLPGIGLGETRYVPPVPPAALSPAVAGQIMVNASAAEAEAETRRERARRLRTRLAGIPRLQMPPERGEPGYLRLPARIAGQATQEILSRSASRLGIVATYPRPLPSLAAERDRVRSEDTPGASALARELFTLPTHRHVGQRHMDRIVRFLEEAV